MAARPEVLRSDWDHNGSWRVEVAGPWPRTDASERAARRAARNVDTMRRVQWSRLDAVRLEGVRLVYTFTVSRLPRS